MHHLENGVMMSTLTVQCRCREEATKTARLHILLSLSSLPSSPLSSLSIVSLLFLPSLSPLSSFSSLFSLSPLVSLLSCFISHVTSQCQILTSSLKLRPFYYIMSDPYTCTMNKRIQLWFYAVLTILISRYNAKIRLKFKLSRVAARLLQWVADITKKMRRSLTSREYTFSLDRLN